MPRRATVFTTALEIFSAMAGGDDMLINWTGSNLPCNSQIGADCNPMDLGEQHNTGRRGCGGELYAG